MWSGEIVRSIQKPAAVAGLIAAILLAGCQVRPLYSAGAVVVSSDGTIAAGGPTVRQSLRQIDIAEPRDRREQVFRNALIFKIQGGGGEGETRYRLTYRLVMTGQQIALEKISGTPTSYQVRGQISYLLADADTDEALMTDRVTAIASYDRSSQNFANVRARLDGENRVSNELARLVEIRLASYFAARKP